MDNPCRYCVAPKRHVGCHGTCPDYPPWKEENDRRLEIERLEAVSYVDDQDFKKRKESIQNQKDRKKRSFVKKCT